MMYKNSKVPTTAFYVEKTNSLLKDHMNQLAFLYYREVGKRPCYENCE
jgi:hypothetical protein